MPDTAIALFRTAAAIPLSFALFSTIAADVPDVRQGAWRSQGTTIGGVAMLRAYVHGRREGPKAMLFLDREVPSCAPSFLITMDSPSTELPQVVKGIPATTLKVDDNPPLPLPMKMESVGRQLVWSTDSTSMPVRRAAAELGRGKFVTFDLARGPSKTSVSVRFNLAGYAEAMQRTASLCEAEKKKGKP